MQRREDRPITGITLVGIALVLIKLLSATKGSLLWELLERIRGLKW